MGIGLCNQEKLAKTYESKSINMEMIHGKFWEKVLIENSDQLLSLSTK